MTLLGDIKTALQADSTLMALLTGGVHIGIDTGELTRQATPDAFDANDEVKPSVLVVEQTDVKSGPYSRSVITMLGVYFYQRDGYDVIEQAMEMVFDILHEQQIGSKTWQILYSTCVKNQRDPALDCSLSMQRYMAMREK